MTAGGRAPARVSIAVAVAEHDGYTDHQQVTVALGDLRGLLAVLRGAEAELAAARAWVTSSEEETDQVEVVFAEVERDLEKALAALERVRDQAPTAEEIKADATLTGSCACCYSEAIAHVTLAELRARQAATSRATS